jgi:hypothetical protein
VPDARVPERLGQVKSTRSKVNFRIEVAFGLRLSHGPHVGPDTLLEMVAEEFIDGVLRRRLGEVPPEDEPVDLRLSVSLAEVGDAISVLRKVKVRVEMGEISVSTYIRVDSDLKVVKKAVVLNLAQEAILNRIQGIFICVDLGVGEVPLSISPPNELNMIRSAIGPRMCETIEPHRRH